MKGRRRGVLARPALAGSDSGGAGDPGMLWRARQVLGAR
jgi:hypothetical protein